MSDDFYKQVVTCCRCKHTHAEQDRLQVPSKQFDGCTVSTCPRCGAHLYTDGPYKIRTRKNTKTLRRGNS